MHIHGSQNHPRYWGLHFRKCPVIKLDGQSIVHVCEANDEENFVIIELHDDNGKLRTTPQGDEILTERLTGKVEIIGKRIR